MTARELVARRFEHGRFRILGVDLLPLTLGHLQLLEQLGVMDAQNPAELAICCIVCGCTHDKARKRIRSQLIGFWSFLWRIRIGKWDFLEKRDMWGEYLKFNTQLPHVIVNSQQTGRDIPIPAYQTLRTVLLSRLNYSPDTVDSTTFLQAQWDRVTLAAIEGRVEVLDETSEDIDAKMDSIDWDKLEKVGAKLMGAE